MEVEKSLIQIFEFGLEDDKFFFQDFVSFWKWVEKQKQRGFQKRKILSWEKPEWVTRLWTLYEGQGTKNVNFRSRVKEGENLSKRDNEAEFKNEHYGKI